MSAARAELNDLRLFFGTDRRVGSPAVAQRLLPFERVADERTRSALYRTGQTRAAAQRLQRFAAKHGVTLWREPRRRRPSVAERVDGALIARFVEENGLSEGGSLTVRDLERRGHGLVRESSDQRGARTRRLAVCGAEWTLRARAAGDEVWAQLAFETHGDDRHEEREALQREAGRVFDRAMRVLTKRWGKPTRTAPGRWGFPRATVELRLEASDLFTEVSVRIKARKQPAHEPSAKSERGATSSSTKKARIPLR